jgi:hypothetical protein
VIKQQPGDLGRHLISSVVPDPRQDREAVVRRDELGSAFGSHSADRAAVKRSVSIHGIGGLNGNRC